MTLFEQSILYGHVWRMNRPNLKTDAIWNIGLHLNDNRYDPFGITNDKALFEWYNIGPFWMIKDMTTLALQKIKPYLSNDI